MGYGGETTNLSKFSPYMIYNQNYLKWTIPNHYVRRRTYNSYPFWTIIEKRLYLPTEVTKTNTLQSKLTKMTPSEPPYPPKDEGLTTILSQFQKPPQLFI